LTNQGRQLQLDLLLLVESAADAESILLELRREGLQFSSRRVCTEADFLAELRNHSPDLIAADYTLTSYDGLSALRLAQAERPEVPFILLFGTLDGERAIDALRRGATDCVAKERLSCLGPVVRRALLEAEERRQRQKAEEALRASEQNYREIFNATHDAIAVHDAVTGEILNVNQALLDMLGCSREDLSNLTALMFLPAGSHSHEEAVRRIRLAFAEGPQVFEYEIRRKSGERFWCEVSLRGAALDGKGCVLAVARDITARKAADEALRTSEEKFAKVFHNAPVLIAITDFASGTYIEVNEEFLRISGFTREELIGHTSTELSWLGAEEREWFVEKFPTHGRIVEMEVTFRTKGGNRLVGLVKGEQIGIAGRRCLLTIMVDITARKLSEQQLLEYQHRLQSLAAELSRAEQEERRRLATLLHDDVIQSLALSSIKLGALRKSLSNAGQRSEVESTRALIEQAIQSTRSLTFQLSPPILHELGLEPALDWLAEQFTGEHGLSCRFTSDAQPKPLTEEAAGVLFAAVRELLVNTVKHAQATQAEVSSCREGDAICLRVTDNGVGLDTAAVAGRAGNTGGFGLLNIRERLGYLGGSCDLQSEPGRGTRVVLRAPLKPL